MSDLEGSYPTHDEARNALQSFAKASGFAVVRSRSTKGSYFMYACDRAGIYVDKLPPGTRKRKAQSRKCGCEFEAKVQETKSGFTLRIIAGAHNHGASLDVTAHSSHRHSTLEQQKFIIDHYLGGMNPVAILAMLKKREEMEPQLVLHDINHLIRRRKLDSHSGEMQMRAMIN